MFTINEIIDSIESDYGIKQISQIFLDFDGCIAHSCQAVVDILNKRYGTHFTGADVTTWDFTNCFPNMTADKIEDIFNSKVFFDIVQPIDGAFEFMDKYRNNIYVVTKSNPDNYKYKCEWLKERGFGDIPVIGLPLNVGKNIINMVGDIEGLYPTVFIDDSADNVNRSRASFPILFHEYSDGKIREWQKSKRKRVYDAYGW